MEPTKNFSQPFYIEAWRIEPRLNRIVGIDGTKQIEPKIMQVLVYLAEHEGEVVRRDHTLDTVWAETVVGDEVLSRCISELRKVFKDTPRQPRVIETIPRVGYRLIAPIRFDTNEKDGLPDLPPVLAPPKPPTISQPKANLLTRSRYWGAIVTSAVFVALVVWQMWPTEFVYKPALRTIPITSTADAELDPAISPDGTHVAYIWSGGNNGFLNLYVKVIGTETPLQLTNTPLYEWSPTWSPDGTQIAFARSGKGILALPVLGGPERKLADIGTGRTDLDWSPRSHHIVFSTQETRDAPSTLFLLDLTTLETTTLTPPLAGFPGDFKPVFSPDGNQIAFIRALDTGNDIHVIPTEGGDARRITFDGLEISGVDWTSDGQHIVYSSNRDGTSSLWKIAASGGYPERLPLGGGVEGTDPNVANNRLVFTQSFTETNIWQVNLNAGGLASSPTPLIRSTRRDESPQFSPDGSRIAFASTRSGSAEIWLTDTNGQNLVQLTHFEGPQTRNPRWSSDGTRLVFESHAEGYAGVFTTDIATGHTTRFTEGSFIERLPNWSPDNQWIYFDSNRSGRWDIWKRSTAGGEAVQVTTAGGSGSTVSSDGAYIYYTKPITSGLWRQPTAGGDEKRILDDFHWSNWGCWTLHDNGIYYLTTDRRVESLHHYDFATESSTALLDFPATVASRQPSLTVSPNGMTLLFPQIDYNYFDIMLSEPFE